MIKAGATPLLYKFFSSDMISRYLIFVALVLYSVSMFLPGIITKPTKEDNPKYAFCVQATKPTVECQFLTMGFKCGSIPTGRTKSTDSMTDQEVIDYCGNDWDKLLPGVWIGYKILLYGWAGFFIFNFAWWGNPLVVIAFISFMRRNFRNAFYSSAVAFAFGMCAIALFRIPRNEGGVNDQIVDHLGIGWYMWMLSILLVVIFAFNFWKKADPQNSISLRRGLVILVALTSFLFIPTFTVAYNMKSISEGYEQEEIERKQRTTESLLVPFREFLAAENYRVTEIESGNILYFEKGQLVRTYIAKKDQTADYMIFKNKKLYTVNPATKTFNEIDRKSNDWDAAYKKMISASKLSYVLDSAYFISESSITDNNTQSYTVNNVSLLMNFESNPKLLSSIRISNTEPPQSIITLHYQYLKLTDQELEEAKTFPRDYAKIAVPLTQ